MQNPNLNFKKVFSVKHLFAKILLIALVFTGIFFIENVREVRAGDIADLATMEERMNNAFKEFQKTIGTSDVAGLAAAEEQIKVIKSDATRLLEAEKLTKEQGGIIQNSITDWGKIEESIINNAPRELKEAAGKSDISGLAAAEELMNIETIKKSDATRLAEAEKRREDLFKSGTSDIAGLAAAEKKREDLFKSGTSDISGLTAAEELMNIRDSAEIKNSIKKTGTSDISGLAAAEELMKKEESEAIRNKPPPDKFEVTLQTPFAKPPPSDTCNIEKNAETRYQTLNGYEWVCYPKSDDWQQVIRGEDGSEVLENYAAMLYKWLAGFIGVVSVLMLVVSGIQISTAGTNQEGLQEGKNRIYAALAGLTLLFLASLILYTINPNFFGETEYEETEFALDEVPPEEVEILPKTDIPDKKNDLPSPPISPSGEICDLRTFHGKNFEGKTVKAHKNFIPLLEKIDNVAGKHGITLIIQRSFQKDGSSIQGAIVSQSGTSNHKAGTAIDFNLKNKNGESCASSCLKNMSKAWVKPFFAELFPNGRNPGVGGLRWGGYFSNSDPVHFDNGLNRSSPSVYIEYVNAVQSGNCDQVTSI